MSTTTSLSSGALFLLLLQVSPKLAEAQSNSNGPEATKIEQWLAGAKKRSSMARWLEPAWMHLKIPPRTQLASLCLSSCRSPVWSLWSNHLVLLPNLHASVCEGECVCNYVTRGGGGINMPCGRERATFSLSLMSSFLSQSGLLHLSLTKEQERRRSVLLLK